MEASLLSTRQSTGNSLLKELVRCWRTLVSFLLEPLWGLSWIWFLLTPLLSGPFITEDPNGTVSDRGKTPFFHPPVPPWQPESQLSYFGPPTGQEEEERKRWWFLTRPQTAGKNGLRWGLGSSWAQCSLQLEWRRGKGNGRISSAPPFARNQNLIEVLGQFALFFFQILPGARRRRISMSSSLSAGTLSL